MTNPEPLARGQRLALRITKEKKAPDAAKEKDGDGQLPLQLPRAARFVPRDAALSLHWLADPSRLPADVQAVAPASAGSLSEAVSLERLSKFPIRGAKTLAQPLPYLARESPKLLVELQLFAETELRRRAPGGGPSEAALEGWLQTFERVVGACRGEGGGAGARRAGGGGGAPPPPPPPLPPS